MFKRFLSLNSQNFINITKKAWTKINDIYKQDKNCYSLLFSASSGGCNGFNYIFKPINKNEYIKIIDENKKFKPNIIVNCKNNSVIIDPLSEILLLGTTIDYLKEDYKEGIYESKFIFNPNKNIANTCGCGISFSLK